MELFEYLKHLYRYRFLILAGLLVGSLAGFYLAASTPETYQATTSLYIQRKTQEPSDEYFTYEGYYAQQTAINHTDTVFRLLGSDEIIKQAAIKAGQEGTVAQTQALRGNITPFKASPQLIRVTVTQPTSEDAASLANGLSETIKQRTIELSQFGDQDLSIDQIEDQPMVLTILPSKVNYAAIGGLVGLVLAIMSSTLLVYLQYQRQQKPQTTK